MATRLKGGFLDGAQDPETLKRLEAVAPNVLAGERAHLLWLVPGLFEKGLGEEQKGMYGMY